MIYSWKNTLLDIKSSRWVSSCLNRYFGMDIYLFSLVEEITYIAERCWCLRGRQICDRNALSSSHGEYDSAFPTEEYSGATPHPL